MRLLQACLLIGLGAVASAVEPGDLRLTFELHDDEFEAEVNGSDSDDYDWETNFGLRLQLVQPLGLMYTGDIISVVGLGYHHAKSDDLAGSSLVYQNTTARYGMGYRAEFGESFDLDMYPYFGLGWTFLEWIGVDDPALLFECGARIDATGTFNKWQLTGGLGINYRYSDHTLGGADLEVTDMGPTLNLGGGYRF